MRRLPVRERAEAQPSGRCCNSLVPFGAEGGGHRALLGLDRRLVVEEDEVGCRDEASARASGGCVGHQCAAIAMYIGFRVTRRGPSLTRRLAQATTNDPAPIVQQSDGDGEVEGVGRRRSWRHRGVWGGSAVERRSRDLGVLSGVGALGVVGAATQPDDRGQCEDNVGAASQSTSGWGTIGGSATGAWWHLTVPFRAEVVGHHALLWGRCGAALRSLLDELQRTTASRTP